MAADDPDPLETFEAADTSVVSDALDEHGLDGVITGLAPVHPDHAAVGRARPIRFEPTDGGERTNFPYAMLERIAEGEVFVIDGVAGLSSWGGLACRLGAAGGLAGVITTGGYRDVPDIRAGSFPVFGAEPSPRTGQYRVHVASTDEPITVSGVEVAPGDVVVADATGIAVVPAEDEAAVAETVRTVLEEEAEVEGKIEAGAGVEDLRSEDREF